MVQEIRTAPEALRGTGVTTHVTWHGDFGPAHSLALANERITRELARLAGFAVDRRPIRATPPPGTGARDLDRGVDVTHAWPPRLTPPSGRRWVAFQPWEFGSMPVEWLAPLRDTADDVWVYTSFNRRCYVADGVAAERVATIPLGVDVEAFHPHATQNPKIRRGTTKSFRFLFIGGTIHRKGIDILLRAWRRAFKKDDDVCLVIKDFCRKTAYQGQTNEDAIRKLAADPEAAEILYVTDDLDPRDVPGLYTACHALVHPYRGEGFGLPVAEAMACGLPAILTRGGACDEVCPPDAGIFVTATHQDVPAAHGLVHKGFLLEPSVDELAAMMRLAAAHPARMRELGERGRTHAAEKLTWAQTASAVAERIALVLSRPRRAAAAGL